MEVNYTRERKRLQNVLSRLGLISRWSAISHLATVGLLHEVKDYLRSSKDALVSQVDMEGSSVDEHLNTGLTVSSSFLHQFNGVDFDLVEFLQEADTVLMLINALDIDLKVYEQSKD